MSKTIFHFYLEGELKTEIDVENAKRMSPEWTGEMEVGDFVTYEDEEKQIIQMIHNYPNTVEDDYIIEVHIK